MSRVYQYQAMLIQNGAMDAGYVIFPYDLRQETGRGRIHVRAFFDGILYEGSIVNMGVKDMNGNICYIVGVPRTIRKKIGKQFGDIVEVVIQM